MDIEKTIEFIVQTQAKLEASASVQNEQLQKLAQTVENLSRVTGNLADNQIITARNINTLTERQSDTDSRLRLLIDAVAKLIERNGQS